MNIKKKMINENSLSKSDIFFTYDNYLDKKSNEVLNNDYFHSNITLSRNHLSGSDLLKNMINDCNYFKLKYIFIIKNILIFYIKNLYYFFFWFFYYLYSNIFSLFNFFSHKKFLANKIILIQTYVDRYSIISNGKINDNYFKELYQYLDSNKKKYFILQNISEKITNLKDRVNIIRLSLSSSNHYINEFNFLNIFDLFRVLAFIFFYPINLILYLGNIKEENKVDNFYKYDLIKTLPKTSFLPYVQLLFGKKIREEFKNKKEVKVISWNENQLIHRNFNRGISSKNIKIYGCQYFIKYPSCRWMYIRESDKKFNVLPDIILVPGKKYLPKNSILSHKIGSPFRYRDVYSYKKQAKNIDKISIIVMLPYEQKQSENLLNFINSCEYLKDLKIDIKIHPDFSHRKFFFEKKINKNWRIVNQKLNFSNYNILISKASGSIIEFIARGFSVLVVSDNNPLSLNPLEKYGKKIIWDSIEKPEDFYSIINSLYEIRKKKYKKIKEISNRFKFDYFKKVKKNNFKLDFDL